MKVVRQITQSTLVLLMLMAAFAVPSQAATPSPPPQKAQSIERASLQRCRAALPCTSRERALYRKVLTARWWIAAQRTTRSASASWYGPGLYGNGMACGGTLWESSVVIAHKTLPCGTVLWVCYGGRCVSAPVRDRGPFVDGRELDLGPGVRNRLGFGGVGTVRMTVLGK